MGFVLTLRECCASVFFSLVDESDGIQDHLVAFVEQCAQRQIDEFADSVADKHFLGRHIHDSAFLLLHDHSFTCRKDTLLVAIGLALGEILDHRQAHRLGRPEAEQPGIADVQRNNFVALAFQFVSAV